MHKDHEYGSLLIPREIFFFFFVKTPDIICPSYPQAWRTTLGSSSSAISSCSTTTKAPGKLRVTRAYTLRADTALDRPKNKTEVHIKFVHHLSGEEETRNPVTTCKETGSLMCKWIVCAWLQFPHYHQSHLPTPYGITWRNGLKKWGDNDLEDKQKAPRGAELYIAVAGLALLPGARN